MSKKPKLISTDKFKKGVIIDKHVLLKMLSDHIDKAEIEIKEKSAYIDESESLVISIFFKS